MHRTAAALQGRRLFMWSCRMSICLVLESIRIMAGPAGCFRCSGPRVRQMYVYRYERHTTENKTAFFVSVGIEPPVNNSLCV